MDQTAHIEPVAARHLQSEVGRVERDTARHMANHWPRQQVHLFACTENYKFN